MVKKNLREFFDDLSQSRDSWIDKSSYFYENDYKYMRFLIPENSSILELGCGTGRLIHELKPSFATGVDISKKMILEAKNNYSNYEFFNLDIESEKLVNTIKKKYDFIILSDLIGLVDDVQEVLSSLHHFCHSNSKIVLIGHSWRWEKILNLAEFFRQKMPSFETNWFSDFDLQNLFKLSDLEVIKKEMRILSPRSFFGLGRILNKFFATLPLIRGICLRNYYVLMPKREIFEEKSVTVLIPCRNEKGNIENAVKRLPDFGRELEIFFVEGNSHDGTLDEIKRVQKKYSDKNIRYCQQDGIGKGDAVRKGFDNAKGEILMILDADLTVKPEDLIKFYNAIKLGKGDFINGSRLIYPMEDNAMRFLNFWANRTFSVIFSWLLNQRITDTLCGTKVISKENYIKLVENRSYFGDFDPFGDFDLIFGASKLNLRILEVPIRYQAREYGSTQISRFKHGLLLLRMVLFAYKKLKLI